MSDVLRTLVDQGNIEIGSVINVEKLKTQHPDLVKDAGHLVDKLSAVNIERVYLAIRGEPLAINGELAIGENLSLKLGNLSIPQALFGVFGIPVEKLQQQTMALQYMYVKDIDLSQKQIDMAVRPVF